MMMTSYQGVNDDTQRHIDQKEVFERLPINKGQRAYLYQLLMEEAVAKQQKAYDDEKAFIDNLRSPKKSQFDRSKYLEPATIIEPQTESSCPCTSSKSPADSD